MTVFWTFMGALVASILLVLFPGMAYRKTLEKAIIILQTLFGRYHG